MNDPYLAVTTDSFNNPCSAPVPLVGTTADEWVDPTFGTTWKDDVRRICDHHRLTVARVNAPDRHRPVAFCRFEVFARLRVAAGPRQR